MKGRDLTLLIIVALIFIGIGTYGSYATSYIREQRLRQAERDADRYIQFLERQTERDIKSDKN